MGRILSYLKRVVGRSVRGVMARWRRVFGKREKNGQQQQQAQNGKPGRKVWFEP